MIVFNKPPVVGNEDKYVIDAINKGKLCGDGYYGIKCQKWFEKSIGIKKALMTPNCTQALEMAAILIDIKPGDEVIMPSYTFVSTANAFALRGAKIVFVDIHKGTMNIDENLIEEAITNKTKAIVPVHYAGVACEMDKIMQLAEKYNIYVIEDAAQGVMSTYKGRALGTIGHMGAYSFHETKNYTSGGEGGLLLINDSKFEHRAEVIREKGTNRSQFFRGQVDKYSWIDIGGSYLPSELQSAYLYAQLEVINEINDYRLNVWDKYFIGFKKLSDNGTIELPAIPIDCKHNAHMFYIKVRDIDVRTKLINFLKDKKIDSAFHYIPLHTAIAASKFSVFHGIDIYTTTESERLVRLPIWYGLDNKSVEKVIAAVELFFKELDE